MREAILEHTENWVRTLTMNRPEARNAFNIQQWTDLRDALVDASGDDGVRVVILTGAPGAFTAGQDLSEMNAPPGGGDHPFASCMEQIIEFDKPLIAAVNGVGVGCDQPCYGERGGGVRPGEADVLAERQLQQVEQANCGPDKEVVYWMQTHPAKGIEEPKHPEGEGEKEGRVFGASLRHAVMIHSGQQLRTEPRQQDPITRFVR